MFGERLRELRKERKLTMKELGQKFSLAESTISGYENEKRKPDLEMINSFADFFEVSSDYLLGRSPYIQKVGRARRTSEKIDTLEEINELVREHGIEDAGFFDIEEWKNLSPEDMIEIKKHFEWVAQKAKERNTAEK
ncbi:helix-turn-helix domain-containing protein [Metabacillus fastidiosus]|uniref:helix-turn-helix domain-containing protein n=1 Tax=Metabacillus fastidiosus TaxID=1458 RepID=UPI003D28D9B1